MPATVKEAMKHGPPLSPKLREQIVSATHNVAPSTYTLCSGVVFTITILSLSPPRIRSPPESMLRRAYHCPALPRGKG